MCGTVQFVFDGRLQPNEPYRMWRTEETNVNYDAILVEVAILRQIFQVGDA